MKAKPQIKPQYITDEKGKRKSVILSVEEYEDLLEDLEDLAVLAERREEKSTPHGEVIADLKKNGYL